MSTTFFGASFDAADAARAAQFWAAVLGREVAAGADEHDAVVEAGDPGRGPRLAFHQIPEAKTVKNRFHPDRSRARRRPVDHVRRRRGQLGLGHRPQPRHRPGPPGPAHRDQTDAGNTRHRTDQDPATPRRTPTMTATTLATGETHTKPAEMVAWR